MISHTLEIVLKVFEKSGGVEDESEVLEVFLEGVGDGFTEIHAAQCFMVNFLNSFMKGLQGTLNVLKVTCFVLPLEQFI